MPSHLKHHTDRHTNRTEIERHITYWGTDHSVKLEDFDPAKIRGVRDQICTTKGPKVNCVRLVDF